jgi:hypothetical protein
MASDRDDRPLSWKLPCQVGNIAKARFWEWEKPNVAFLDHDFRPFAGIQGVNEPQFLRMLPSLEISWNHFSNLSVQCTNNVPHLLLHSDSRPV